MKVLKVLHIASFSGNIGDNASHDGFRTWFETMSGIPVDWCSLEIREFYWKERKWDVSFIEHANRHDMVIIGGGNYFELWVDDSPTGTSIAIDPTLFVEIKIPIFFNALGVDAGQGVSGQSRERFSKFLSFLLSSTQYLVSIRNDGALSNLSSYVDSAYAAKVPVLPDHGFFTKIYRKTEQNVARRNNDRKLIAINIANDMPEIRFSKFTHPQEFVKEFSYAITQILSQNQNVDIVFVPHIFRDLEIIVEMLNALNDRIRRTRVSVFAYGSGDAAASNAMNVYKHADIVLGMRFHANVCPLGSPR